MQALQQKIAQLDEDNKRWMRLAGMSELTGLPNRVMLSRVLLPGAVKKAASRRESLGCILISPEGLAEVNGKHGHEAGDLIWYAGVSTLVFFGRRHINRGVYSIVLGLCGIIMIVFGLYLGISSFYRH